MSVLPSLLAFGLAATLLTMTPGLDTAMVLRSAVGRGFRR
jgi:threonine/homoserine/homoserine lactone efflux protein